MKDESVSPTSGKVNEEVNYSTEGRFAAASSAPTRTNQFRKFWDLGYTRLIPITPPGCDVSPNSSLARRPKDLGKAPGVRGNDYLWRGVDWGKLEATEADLDTWHEMGAGVGVKTGQGLIVIDIDTLDRELGDICGTTATKILGHAENRVGRSPKRAKCYRVSEPVPYQRLRFDGGHVELLSDGKQFVVSGLHPATGRPYEWPRGIPRFAELKEVTPAQIATYFAALAKALPAAKHEVSSLPKEAGAVEPVQLEGKAEDVRKALAALPNDDRFGGYSEYQKVAQAIKGALPDDDELGLELFQEWASRWTGGPYEPDTVAKHWKTTQASHSLGASYLFNLSAAHSSGNFTAAETWFAPTEEGVATPDGALGESEWGEPVDVFGDGDPSVLMDLPAQALPDVLDRYVRDVAARMGVPEAFVAVGAVVTASAAVGGKLRIQPKARDSGWQVPAFLWGLIVEDPGGKKSPVMAAVTAPLAQLDTRRASVDIPKRQAWEVESRKRKKDAPAVGQRPRIRRSTVDSFTVEALRDVLVDNPKGVLVSADEITGLIGGLDQYKGGLGSDRADLLKLMDGQPRTFDRVGHSHRVECWGASVLGGVQPRKLAEIARGLDPDGLLQRFLPIVGDNVRRAGIDRRPDESAVRGYTTTMEGLAEVQDYGNPFEQPVITLSPEAQAFRFKFEQRVNNLLDAPQLADAWRGHLNKWDGFFARLLLVFHMVEHWSQHGAAAAELPVSGDTAGRVWRFAAFLLSHAIRFYELVVGQGAAGEAARRAAGIILILGQPTVSRRDLYEKHRAWRAEGARDLTDAMRVLGRLGWCSMTESEHGVPSSWGVNPLVFDRFKERGVAEGERRRREYARVQAAVAERRALLAAEASYVALAPSAPIAPCRGEGAFS